MRDESQLCMDSEFSSLILDLIAVWRGIADVVLVACHRRPQSTIDRPGQRTLAFRVVAVRV
jgi:hypothetical protein